MAIRRTDEITAWATVAAAGVAAIAAIISVVQSSIANHQSAIAAEQIELTKEQNKLGYALLRTSEEQAGIASRQADVASDTEERQLRPYISMRLTNRSVDNDEYHLGIELKNNGQTPALNVRFHYKIYVTEGYSVVMNKESFDKSNFGHGPNVLAQSSINTIDMIVSKKTEYQEMPLQGALQVAMKTYYSDYFGKSRDSYLCLAVVKVSNPKEINLQDCESPPPN